MAAWRRELGEALGLGADHLSLYELTIEPGAAFARAVKRGDWAPADDEGAADLYEITHEMTEASGYHAYEISNHARGRAAPVAAQPYLLASGDWVGAGPGAHGRLTASASASRLKRPKARAPTSKLSDVLASAGPALKHSPRSLRRASDCRWGCVWSRVSR